MSEYEKEHCTYDQFGLLSVHCIRCNTTIRKRVEVPSKTNPDLAVHAIMTLSNYREREVRLSDGSVMYPMFCADCVNIPLDAEKTMGVVRAGWDKENEAAGRPETAIEEFSKQKEEVSIIDVGDAMTEKERIARQEKI